MSATQVKKMKVHSSTDVSIVIEGTEVLDNCGSVAKACLVLMGIINAVNLSYPPKTKDTFEVFQKLLLELDVLKLFSLLFCHAHLLENGHLKNK